MVCLCVYSNPLLHITFSLMLLVMSVYTFSPCTVRTTITFPESANHTFITNEGNSATFRCVAYGIPAPSISWRRLSTNQTLNSVNDSRIVVGDPTVVTVFQSAASGDVEQVERTLTLNNTQDEDSGSYECVASNMVGSGGETDSDQQEFQLYVRGECVVVYVRGECVVVLVRGPTQLVEDCKCNNITKCSNHQFIKPFTLEAFV